jgi:5-methylcytosine-specific restriction endonuclease McrA
MPSDPFYHTSLWRTVCRDVALRSGGVCEVPRCTSPAKVVDHIISRRNGGVDHASNARHLCRLHDNQVKEKEDGTRKSNGVFKVIGCDVDGWPKSVTN